MKKIGIIGYGTIAATYIKSLSYLGEEYQLLGVYDINHTKAKSDLENITKVFDSLDEILNTNIECVIISTPIHTHYDIAMRCIKSKKQVILEKPATVSLSELESLFQTAREYNVCVYTAFHSSFAMDIEWYLSNQDLLEPCYHLDKIRKIECGFYDPYMENGMIFEDRVSLCGSYIDSGVNILSVCNRFVSLENFTKESHSINTDENGVTYSSETTYVDNGIRIVMHTGWDKHINQKRTVLTFRDTDNKILLDHSNQCVKLLYKEEEKILYKETERERLVNHYINVFQDYMNIKNFSTHEQRVMKVHELLLKNPWNHQLQESI